MSEKVLKTEEAGNKQGHDAATTAAPEAPLTPKEILSRTLKEAWKTAPLRETRRNLEYAGKTVTAPAYEKAAEEQQVDEIYEEIWSRRYKELQDLEREIKEMKREAEQHLGT